MEIIMNTFIIIFLSPILCALIYTIHLDELPFTISPTTIDTFDSLLSILILNSAKIYFRIA